MLGALKLKIKSGVAGIVKRWQERQDKKANNLFSQLASVFTPRHDYSKPFPPPVLTGARLDRVAESCSPRNLTAQPRYRRQEYERLFNDKPIETSSPIL